MNQHWVAGKTNPSRIATRANGVFFLTRKTSLKELELQSNKLGLMF
jgi:hypothetical protein